MTAFSSQRQSLTGQIRWATKTIELVDKVEQIMPTFVGNRYRIMSVYEGGDTVTLEISPDGEKPEPGKPADKLHADVTKLFDFLKTKQGTTDKPVTEPTRGVGYGGTSLRYRFVVPGLPALAPADRLEVIISGIPEGSACRIVAKSKGKREFEDFEYTLVCDE